MDNVLITHSDDVCVVDFASAVWLPPGRLVHRFLFPYFRKIDESAYLKWKQILGAGPYSEREISLLRRHRFWRSFWVFNPRKSGDHDPPRPPDEPGSPLRSIR